MALQQEMRAQGLNVATPDSLFRSPPNPSATLLQKSPNADRVQEEQGASPVPTIMTSVSAATDSHATSKPASSSSHPPDREKDKSFGKMSHYVNELKKELDYACRSRKEHNLETQRLRERCVQMEEKLQSERNKNVLLEEQLDKSLRKQRELQTQLDALLSSQQEQQQIQQQQQSVAVQVQIDASNEIPTPLGTPTGIRKSFTSAPLPAPPAAAALFVPSAHVTAPPNLASSVSGPISLSSSSSSIIPALIPTKSHSTSNIPSLCGISTLPPNMSSSNLANLSTTTSATALASSSSSNSLQTLNPLSSSVTPSTVLAASLPTHNSPIFIGSTAAFTAATAAPGSNPLHDSSSLPSLQSTQLLQQSAASVSEWGMGTGHSLSETGGGGGGGVTYATDLQVMAQGDEFDSFIASRGAPSDEWTAADTSSVAVTVPIFPTSLSPTLSI
jgi:hypothetical protein